MGSAVSSEISKRAFLPPPSTYSSTLEGLEWASGEDDSVRVPFVAQVYPDAKFTVLFSHGNAEDLGDLQSWMKYLSCNLGVTVYSYEYPGYGVHSPTEPPSEWGCYESIKIMYEHLTITMGIPSESVVLWGRSLGSGPTVHLASELWSRTGNSSQSGALLSCWSTGDPAEPGLFTPIGGVVLQSPITSAIRVVSSALAFRVFDIFENIHKIDRILSPVIIVHGKQDLVVPFDHGVALFAKCKRGFRFLQLDDAGHNDIELRHAASLLTSVSELLNSIEGVEEDQDV